MPITVWLRKNGFRRNDLVKYFKPVLLFLLYIDFLVTVVIPSVVLRFSPVLFSNNVYGVTEMIYSL